MTERPRQLALPLPTAPRFDPAGFVHADSNSAARAWLDPESQWPLGRLALWGEEGSGKSHLVQLWAGQTGAALLNGAGLRFVPPQTALAIDDADLAPEATLLHMINAADQAGVKLLLAARLPPARWLTRLPDLASRLRASVSVGISPPDDDMLRTLLRRLLAARQLPVAGPVQDWLLLRLPRTAAAVIEAAARLDRAALAAGRSVTRPLAEAVLRDLQHDSETWHEPDYEDFGSVPAPDCQPEPTML